jgi:hypothetical protein
MDPSPLHLLCRSALENPERSEPCDVAPVFSLSRHLEKFEAKKQDNLESMDALSPPPVPATSTFPGAANYFGSSSSKRAFHEAVAQFHSRHPTTSQQPI